MRYHMSRFLITSLLLVFVAMATPGLPTRATATDGIAQGDPIFVGAGDIAACGSEGDELTANLLDITPGDIFTVGDNVYGQGTLEDYQKCYEPSWGRHKGRTHPIPGNHDYHNGAANGYFTYFGGAAGTPGKGYYSFNIGSWHIVALNTTPVRGLQEEQTRWLRADLAANPALCTLALAHHPVFSSGSNGLSAYTQPYFSILYEYGADVIISGDAHHYERFAPLNIYRVEEPTRGIRQFIVGTGGAAPTSLGMRWKSSESRNSGTWGVLKLTLHGGSYSWEFMPVKGRTFTDKGFGRCVTNETSAKP